MWTFDNPPTKLLQEKYGFTPSPEWLDHVRLSSVRFNDGGQKFDIRRFHDAVLGQGSVPLPILERIIEDFIAAEEKRGP